MSSIFSTLPMPLSLSPHPCFHSPSVPPGTFPLPLQLITPAAISATLPGGPIGVTLLGDAHFWLSNAMDCLQSFHQGGKNQRKFLSVAPQDRFEMGITQGSYLALDQASHLTGGGPHWKKLKNASGHALRLLVENGIDLDNRGQGVADQRPQAGFYELGTPSSSLVEHNLNQVLATLNVQYYQNNITPPSTISSVALQAACRMITDNEADMMLTMANRLLATHPGTNVLLLAGNTDVLARLLQRQASGVPGTLGVTIATHAQATNWTTLKRLLASPPIGLTLLNDSQRQLRQGPGPQGAFDIRLNIADPRWLERDIPHRHIIALDSNVLMESKIPGSPHPAMVFHDAIKGLGLQLAIPLQVINELHGGNPNHPRDLVLDSFANSVHCGLAQGAIDMRTFYAPPATLPGPILPAVSPIALDKDNRIRWELWGMLRVKGLVPGDLTMITADKGMAVGMKSMGMGAILMAQSNNMVPGAVCYPAGPTDLVQSAIEIIRKLA